MKGAPQHIKESSKLWNPSRQFILCFLAPTLNTVHDLCENYCHGTLFEGFFAFPRAASFIAFRRECYYMATGCDLSPPSCALLEGGEGDMMAGSLFLELFACSGCFSEQGQKHRQCLSPASINVRGTSQMKTSLHARRPFDVSRSQRVNRATSHLSSRSPTNAFNHVCCHRVRYVNSFAEKKSYDAERLLRCSWDDMAPSEEDLVRDPLLRELFLWHRPPAASRGSIATKEGEGVAVQSPDGGVEETKGEDGVLAETKEDGKGVSGQAGDGARGEGKGAEGARAGDGPLFGKKKGGIAARFQVLQVMNRKLREALPYLDLAQVWCGSWCFCGGRGVCSERACATSSMDWLDGTVLVRPAREAATLVIDTHFFFPLLSGRCILWLSWDRLLLGRPFSIEHHIIATFRTIFNLSMLPSCVAWSAVGLRVVGGSPSVQLPRIDLPRDQRAGLTFGLVGHGLRRRWTVQSQPQPFQGTVITHGLIVRD